MIVINNVCQNQATADVAGFFTGAATCTGVIHFNDWFSLDSTTIDGHVTNRAMNQTQNYAVNVITESGGILFGLAT